MILSLYGSIAASKVLNNNLRYTLPVMFVPRIIKAKIDALGYKYEEVLDKAFDFSLFGSYQNYEQLKAIEESDKPNLETVLGYKDCKYLEVINDKFYGYEGRLSDMHHPYKFSNISLSENERQSMMIELEATMHNVSNTEVPYDISMSRNTIYIILNDNAFVDYDNMFKQMSKDLCSKMLSVIDESFVYRSSFFKAL